MRTDVDLATATPEEFATKIGRYVQLLERPGKPTPTMRDARAAAAVAMSEADAAGRQDLFEALARRNGVGAMELAAQEGVAGAIRRLSAAGVDCDASLKSSMGITPLMFAANHGHADAVVALLECGADLAKHGMGDNALGAAISKGHADVARAILQRTSDVSNLRYMRGTILDAIATHGGAEYVAAIVDRGVSPDTPDNSGKPPIATAAEHGRADVIRALLAAGASTELPPSPSDAKQFDLMMRHKDPPLVLAVKRSHCDSVEALLEGGTRLDAADNRGLTAYDWARKKGRAQIVARLRAQLGFAPETLDARDLIVAARKGDVQTIESAVAQGADVDYCDEESADAKGHTIPGRTALMWAIVKGRTGAARLLLALGADPKKRERMPFGSGASAWELAAKYARNELLALFQQKSPDEKMAAEALMAAAAAGNVETVAQLLDAGVPVDVRNSERRTPLMVAAGDGQAAVLRLLLKRGAQVNLRDKGTFAGTALHKAAGGLSVGRRDRRGVVQQFGDPVQCIQVLLEHGANPNEIRQDGDYPLMQAAGHPEVLRMLLQAGASVEPADRIYGCTALHWAAMRGNAESVHLLLQAGANPSPVDKKGQTPLDEARKRNLPEIAETLEAAGGLSGMETEEGRAAQDETFAKELSERKRAEAAAKADEALRPDFSAAVKSKDFREAVKALESLCGVESKGDDDQPGLVYCKVALQEAENIMSAERERFADLGCTPFRCGKAFFPDDDELLALLPTTDPYEIVAAMGVAGPNYGVYVSDVVAALKELHEKAPFRVVKAGYDTVGLEFMKKIPKRHVQRIAVRLYELCPDLIDQGFMSMTKLRKHLEAERELTLWWD